MTQFERNPKGYFGEGGLGDTTLENVQEGQTPPTPTPPTPTPTPPRSLGSLPRGRGRGGGSAGGRPPPGWGGKEPALLGQARLHKQDASHPGTVAGTVCAPVSHDSLLLALLTPPCCLLSFPTAAHTTLHIVSATLQDAHKHAAAATQSLFILCILCALLPCFYTPRTPKTHRK